MTTPVVYVFSRNGHYHNHSFCQFISNTRKHDYWSVENGLYSRVNPRTIIATKFSPCKIGYYKFRGKCDRNSRPHGDEVVTVRQSKSYYYLLTLSLAGKDFSVDLLSMYLLWLKVSA